MKIPSNKLIAIVGVAMMLSGCVRDQIKQASTGDNIELIKKYSSNYGNSVADTHQLCYAFLQAKKYDDLESCLNQLETQLGEKKSKKTRLFGLDDATPHLWVMRSEMFIEFGRFEEAIIAARHAIEWIEKNHEDNRWIIINAKSALALALTLENSKAEASIHIKFLENLDVSYPLYHDHATTRSLALARLYMANKDFKSARTVLESDKMFDFRAAVDNFFFSQSSGDLWMWQRLPRLYMIFKCLQETGDPSKALAGYQQLLSIKAILGNPGIHWRTEFEAGKILMEFGKSKEAENHFKSAIKIIEEQRLTIETELNKVGILTKKSEVYQAYVSLLQKENRVLDALTIAEHSKSKEIVDLLSNEAPFVATLTGNEKNTEILQIKANQAEKQALVQEKMDSVEDAQQRFQIRQKAYQAIKNSGEVEISSLLRVRNLDINHVKKYLRSGEAFLILHNGDKQGTAWLWYAGESVPRMRVYDQTKALALARQVAKEMKEASAGDQYEDINKRTSLIEPVLQKFSEVLLGDWLKEKIPQRLIVVPHGELHHFPYGTLRMDGNYLIDKMSITILPNLGLVEDLGSKPRNSNESAALILSHGDDIPGTEKEGKAIANILKDVDLLQGKQGSETFFRNKSNNKRLLHVASHGIYMPKTPLQSHMRLAADDQNDGQLTVAELYNIRINAHLTTLSACVTGIGEINNNGEDVVGLVRGSFMAGSRYVMASLWNVDDESNSELMIHFYENLKNDANYGTALRKAQIATRKHYPHPVFWAAMQLYG